MQLEIVRLGSIVPNGAGGSGAAAINYIYSMLLQQHDMYCYSIIHINQIGYGGDPREAIMKEGRKIYINIQHPVQEGFDGFPEAEQNLARLEIIHEALLRIAEQDKKLNKDKLINIREQILSNNFNFHFIYKTITHKKNPQLKGSIVVNPHLDIFKIFLIVNEGQTEISRTEIFQGNPSTLMLPPLFSSMKWKDFHEIIITDNRRQNQFQVNTLEHTVTQRNLSMFNVPPYIQIFSSHATESERQEGYRNWAQSMPVRLKMGISHKKQC